MGADQSTPRNGAADAAPQKTCYYEVLGIERQATEDEIKKAYRKKALELHPDRNLHDTENATRKFAEAQTAYEILSDPQERAWYDSHRDSILNGTDDLDGAEDPSSPAAAAAASAAGHTSAQAIFSLMGRFNKTVPMDDSPRGFFTVLSVFFDRLAAEELTACYQQGVEPPAAAYYPPFGKSTDDYALVARPFYAAWTSFATRKSFAWRDRYRPSDAPDRRVRRLVEKENRKAREDAAREFNDAVCSLVAFVRKRDPRCPSSAQADAERQQALRNSAAQQAARARAANQERLRAEAAAYVAPEWARSSSRNSGEARETGGDEEEEEEIQEIECVVCRKSFKNEKQFEAHERSKKHIKAVQQLRRQMKKENADFDLDGSETTSTTTTTTTTDSGAGGKKGKKNPPQPQPPSPSVEEDGGDDDRDGAELEDDNDDNDDNDNDHDPSEPDEHAGAQRREKTKDRPPREPTPVGNASREDTGDGEEDEDEDDDYAPRAKVESRLVAENASGPDTTAGNGEVKHADRPNVPDLGDLAIDDGSGSGGGAKKVGKAKQKREKKAARQASGAQEQDQHHCAVCKETFTSRTKLFSHINEFGHATPVQQRSSQNSRKKR